MLAPTSEQLDAGAVFSILLYLYFGAQMFNTHPSINFYLQIDDDVTMKFTWY